MPAPTSTANSISRNGPGRIERRDDQQPQRVIGNRQQQQKRNRRMLCAEDDARGEVAERDVGRAWESPIRARDSAGRSTIVSVTKISAGPSMPPTAAASGMAARRGECSAPPGAVASATSFAASAKKNAMPMSLTMKCRLCAKRHVALALEVRPDERDERAEDQQPGVIYERFCRLAQFCRRRRRHREVTL